MKRKKQFNRHTLSISDSYINKKVIVLRAPGGNISSPSNCYCEFTPWRACIDAKMYNSAPLDEEAPQLSSSMLKITWGVFYGCETSSRNFYKVPKRSHHFTLLSFACVLKIFPPPIFISLQEFFMYVYNYLWKKSRQVKLLKTERHYVCNFRDTDLFMKIN